MNQEHAGPCGSVKGGNSDWLGINVDWDVIRCRTNSIVTDDYILAGCFTQRFHLQPTWLGCRNGLRRTAGGRELGWRISREEVKFRAHLGKLVALERTRRYEIIATPEVRPLQLKTPDPFLEQEETEGTEIIKGNNISVFSVSSCSNLISFCCGKVFVIIFGG